MSKKSNQYALYFDGKSEREYSRETGIPYATVNKRKKKLLSKLAKQTG